MTLELIRKVARLERELESLRTVDKCGSVHAHYTSDTAQSLTHQIEKIMNFEDKVYDTHNAVTVGASWKFTAPVAGYYLVKSRVLLASTTYWAENEAGRMAIYVNNTLQLVLHRPVGLDSSATSAYKDIYGSGTVHLDAGDYCDVRVIQSSGETINTHSDPTYVWICIDKI